MPKLKDFDIIGVRSDRPAYSAFVDLAFSEVWRLFCFMAITPICNLYLHFMYE